MIKENVKNPDTWLRGLFIVIFGVILYFVYILTWLLVIFQFITRLLTGNLNQRLANFSVGLTQYAYQILNYITFLSEERPFPFNAWPAGNKTALSGRPRARPATRRVSRKKKPPGDAGSKGTSE